MPKIEASSLTFEGIFLAVVGIVIGAVVSWLISRHYFKASTTRRELSWRRQMFRLAEKNVSFSDRITTTFDGVKVASPYLVHLALWNSGNSTIERTAIADVSPLTVEVVGGKILDYTISRIINRANNVILSNVSEAEIGLLFDYIDPDEGITIQIIADKISEHDLKITVNGAIKDRGKIHQALPHTGDSGVNWRDRSIHIVSAIAFPVLTVALAYNAFVSFSITRASTFSDVVATLVFGLISAAIVVALWDFRQEPDARKLPDGLFVDFNYSHLMLSRIEADADLAHQFEILDLEMRAKQLGLKDD